MTILTHLIPSQEIQTFQTTRHDSLEELFALPELAKTTLIQINQTHSNHCVVIDDVVPSDTQLAIQQDARLEIPDTDAIITAKQGAALCVRTADCLPILIYHPKGIAAAVHAGRKGTETHIIIKTLETIKKRYQILSGFIFWFGPAICKSCYQIDKELNHYYDLIEENKMQIKSMLSSDYSIIETNICTACRNDYFYSYRREKGITERQYSVIVMSHPK
ncbi:polyphenol oxidase family protein [Thermoproteota archaeon]